MCRFNWKIAANAVPCQHLNTRKPFELKQGSVTPLGILCKSKVVGVGLFVLKGYSKGSSALKGYGLTESS